MFEKAKAWVFGMLLNKYALGTAVRAWDFMDGYRTQISVGCSAVVLVCGHLGWIPKDNANEFALALGGSSIATFLDKLRKFDGVLNKVEESVKEARKPIDGPAQPQ